MRTNVEPQKTLHEAITFFLQNDTPKSAASAVTKIANKYKTDHFDRGRSIIIRYNKWPTYWHIIEF